MKSGRSWPCLAAALAMAIASGCGTVVTFFPYKSAERAADRVIDDVLAGANGDNGSNGNNGGEAKPAGAELAKAPDVAQLRRDKTEGKAP